MGCFGLIILIVISIVAWNIHPVLGILAMLFMFALLSNYD
jgi:hypothetical protein